MDLKQRILPKLKDSDPLLQLGSLEKKDPKPISPIDFDLYKIGLQLLEKRNDQFTKGRDKIALFLLYFYRMKVNTFLALRMKDLQSLLDKGNLCLLTEEPYNLLPKDFSLIEKGSYDFFRDVKEDFNYLRSVKKENDLVFTDLGNNSALSKKTLQSHIKEILKDINKETGENLNLSLRSFRVGKRRRITANLNSVTIKVTDLEEPL